MIPSGHPLPWYISVHAMVCVLRFNGGVRTELFLSTGYGLPQFNFFCLLHENTNNLWSEKRAVSIVDSRFSTIIPKLSFSKVSIHMHSMWNLRVWGTSESRSNPGIGHIQILARTLKSRYLVIYWPLACSASWPRWRLLPQPCYWRMHRSERNANALRNNFARYDKLQAWVHTRPAREFSASCCTMCSFCRTFVGTKKFQKRLLW